MFSAFGPGTTCTSSHPSCPHVSRICFVAWIRSGTVAYSHFVMDARVDPESGMAPRHGNRVE